ncbi:type IV secretion system protein [Altererythrobacter aquiaggeris]|uniref:type IV secretion system protein n=1 Tax=Aestuarierythrobacter aquiaggeris TaxID=1898396 RepID=UPI00301A0299
MNPSCNNSLEGLGSGIAASLRAVDCLAAETTQSAFGRLFGSEGALAPALTILLTLFIAFFAFALITGRSRIGIASLTPRMVTLGLVLTFATSWAAYQSVVWNLATAAPDQIATIMAGTQRSATILFAENIDIAFAAIEQTTAGINSAEITAFSPPGLLWLGAILFLLGTVGVLVTTRIALAVLIAVGPVFVVMALFPATRGLFVGWLKGVVMLAITPLFAVLAGGVMLEAAVPVLRILVQTPGQIDARAAMAFFLIGAVHVALMALILKVAGTMVAGWTVFGFAKSSSERDDRPAAVIVNTAAAPQSGGMAPATILPPNRQITVPAMARLQPANDSGPAARSAGGSRIVSIEGARPTRAAGEAMATKSRAQGIGSRFRAAPARSTEKLK